MSRRSGSVLGTNLPLESVTFDPNAFDFHIEQHGVLMRHYRAMKCPVGLTDPNDMRGGHDHHENCSNGFIYRPIGLIRVLFTGNGASDKMADVGWMDGSTVQVTFPRTYDDSEAGIHIAPYDRLFLDHEGTEVPNWECFSAQSGPQRFRFPPVAIEHIIDSGGREYDKSLFTVQDGKLVWTTPDRPAVGMVCTAWYTYKPYWYVSRVLHEVRVAEVIDPVEGAKIVRMPYEAILQRENVFKNVSNDPLTKPDPRKQEPPADEGFGSR